MGAGKRYGAGGRPWAPIAVFVCLAGTAPAWGRDKPPLPDPMACPIDVPVRVASDDTLKDYFSMANCAPGRITVAPPRRPLPARAPVTIAPRSDSLRLFRAARRKGRIGDTTVEEARLDGVGTRVVRIIPTLPEPVPAPAAINAGASGGVGSETAVPSPVALTDSTILNLHPATYASPFDDMIASAAARYRVDPLVLHSVITQESRYRPAVVSRLGARGLMQIMPATGAGLGVGDPNRLLDPAVNIQAGASLLRRLWDRLDGRFDLVLAAYNAGEGSVRRFGMRVPPFAETRAYVAGVQNIYRGLALGAGLAGAR